VDDNPYKIKNNDTVQATSGTVKAAESMWRLLYLFLLFVRVYFALCPSYLHPDEIFQGPEPIAGTALRDTMTIHLVDLVCRIPFPISGPSNMGMDIFAPHPECLSSMAHIRLANDVVEMGLGSG
jgi:hypothetical protein